MLADGSIKTLRVAKIVPVQAKAGGQAGLPVKMMSPSEVYFSDGQSSSMYKAL